MTRYEEMKAACQELREAQELYDNALPYQLVYANARLTAAREKVVMLHQSAKEEQIKIPFREVVYSAIVGFGTR